MLKYCPDCQQKYPEDTEFCAQDGTRLRVLDESREDPIIGRVLDKRWVIEERIGEGGMGSVYLASQRSIDRKVAIKTLKGSLSNNREFVDRFFREARVASTINHPHCVMIHDFGQTDDGLLYLAMEYLEGLPLTDRLKHKDMSLKEIIEVSIQISSALAAAHSHNIIHRDLKPDNIFMLSIQDGSTFIKVLDFGIAKVLDSEEKMTKTGQVFGTPEYMSPEQCRGDDIDGRSDLYSMGCILYEMLGGRPPFESNTPMATLVAHVRETPQHILEASGRDIPQSLAELCMRLLSKKAEQRFADAQECRQALEEELTKLSGTGASSAVQSKPPSGPSEPSSTPIPTPAEKVELGKANTAAAPAATGDNRPSAQSQSTSSVTSPQPRKASRGPLLAILGVLVLLVMSAGCIAGAYYFDLLSFIGIGDDAVAESETTDEEGDDESSATKQTADDGSKPGAIARKHPDQGNQGTDPGAEDQGPPGSESGDDEAGENGASAGDDEGGETAETGSGSSSGGGSDGRNNTGSQTVGNQNVGNQNVGNQNVGNQNVDTQVVNNEFVETKVQTGGSGSKDSDSNSGSSSGSDEDENVGSSGGSESAGSDKPDKPKGPRGNARRTKLSATGAACMKPNIKSTLSGVERGFESCFDRQLSSNPSLNGSLILSWNIESDGGVRAPKVLVDRIGNPALASCVVGKLEAARFGPQQGGRCYVRATYSFSK
jgi:serine/threonine protein kinase